LIILFSRNIRGERWVSPPVYKLLLAAHIIVSGGWLGIAFAKLVLAVAAATAGALDVSDALYVSMEVVNVAFPPAAIGTIVTGVLLSLGTKWGLLQHYWVATKLALAVGVIVTGIALVDRLIRQSISAPSGQAVNTGTILGFASAPTSLSRRSGQGSWTSSRSTSSPCCSARESGCSTISATSTLTWSAPAWWRRQRA
jgi:hypothetical protein